MVRVSRIKRYESKDLVGLLTSYSKVAIEGTLDEYINRLVDEFKEMLLELFSELDESGQGNYNYILDSIKIIKDSKEDSVTYYIGIQVNKGSDKDIVLQTKLLEYGSYNQTAYPRWETYWRMASVYVRKRLENHFLNNLMKIHGIVMKPSENVETTIYE